MLTLKCQCCGHEELFENPEKAFQAGWDAPPHFTGYTACNLCPAACAAFGEPHFKAHAHWHDHGRPSDFNALCLPDKDFGKELAPFVAKGNKIVGDFLKKLDG